MDSQSRTDHLIHEMTAGTEKSPDPKFDQTLVELIDHSGIVDPARERVEKLLEKYFKLFGDDMSGAYARIVEGISENELWQSESYLQFLTNFMEEAASFGFPSIFDVFAPATQELARDSSGNEIFDVRNLLLLRIYIADLITQMIPMKQEQLKELKNQLRDAVDASEQADRLSQIAAVIGTMNIPSKGIVNAQSPAPLQKSDPGATRAYSYSRDLVDTQFFPDAEREQALVDIGKLLGRAEHANRGDTFALLKENSNGKLRLIFPDLEDSTIFVSEHHKKNVERALAQPYDVARELFKDQLQQSR